MWKLVRNLLLAGVLFAAGGKLALWAAAQQQAAELAQRIAPWGTLTFASAGADFDGRLTLSGVRFVPKPALALGPVEASALQLHARGAFALLLRAVTRDTGVPEKLTVHLAGAKLPTFEGFGATGDAAWFGRISMVPFETLGCGVVTRLSTSDYQAMGLAPALPDIDLDYRYDAAARTLSLGVGASNPGFAAVKAHADLSGFSPAALTEANARAALRAAQVTVDYRDLGYLARRNRFCAQQLGVAPEAFAEQHIAALQEFLKARRIVPSEAVIALYRQLLSGSGSLQLLSLPNANIAPSQYASLDPEEVLRWLNLTARHNQSPPVLFKLYFLAEPQPAEALAGVDAALVHDPLAEPPPKPATPAGAVTMQAPAVTSVEPSPVAVAPKPVAATPEPTRPIAPPPRANAPVFAPKPVAPPPRAPAEPVAETPLASTVPTLRVSPPPVDPRVAGRASGPAPPPGSTAALVWQGPGVDRLEAPEEKPASQRTFTVVAFDGLAAHVGARVLLITSGGKEIEGRIAGADASGVTLTVARDTGQAQFFVERARILEIRVQRQNRG